MVFDMKKQGQVKWGRQLKWDKSPDKINYLLMVGRFENKVTQKKSSFFCNKKLTPLATDDLL